MAVAVCPVLLDQAPAVPRRYTPVGVVVLEKMRDPPKTVANRGTTQLARSAVVVPPPAETNPRQGFVPEPVMMRLPAASAM